MNFNITPKEVFDILNSDNEILNIYKRIEKKEREGEGWAFHNYEHVKNVSRIAEKILRDIECNEETIYKCKIACLLHDVGALQGKERHAERSFVYAQKLFEEKNWIFDGSENILEAIKNHSSGFETNNIIALSIILADKLDIKKNRITKEGKKIEGNRQYIHIEDITINIKDGILTINFITDGKINIKEVNNYYFTNKVFKAIQSFSKRLNLDYYVLMDNKKWEKKEFFYENNNF